MGRSRKSRVVVAEDRPEIGLSVVVLRTADNKAEILRVRKQGYALVSQELELGLCSIAIPIRAANGTVVDMADGRVRAVGEIDCGYVYVDGSSIGEISDADLKDRMVLGEEGFVSVITVVNRQSGKIISGPAYSGFSEWNFKIIGNNAGSIQ